MHGDFETLEIAPERVAFDAGRDRLFSLGDLIDRGPDSAAALQWITDGRLRASVRGNHEQMLIESIEATHNDDETSLRWLMHDWFPHAVKGKAREQWHRALLALPVAITVHTGHGPVGIVHADVPEPDWSRLLERIARGDTDAAHQAIWRPAGRHCDIRAAPRPDLAEMHHAGTPMHAVLTGHTRVGAAHHNPATAKLWHIDTGAGDRDGAITLARFDCAQVITTTVHVHRTGPDDERLEADVHDHHRDVHIQHHKR